MPREPSRVNERMETVRQRGYRTGLNFLTTIGFHAEDLESALQGSCQNVMDIDGNISRGSFCSNDPIVQEFIREVYKSMAQSNPDYIWLDDDIRLADDMPIYVTYFCDHCLLIFERETGRKYTNENFKKTVND